MTARARSTPIPFDAFQSPEEEHDFRRRRRRLEAPRGEEADVGDGGAGGFVEDVLQVSQSDAASAETGIVT